MSEQLKPCPFCEDIPHGVGDNSTGAIFGKYIKILCDRCARIITEGMPVDDVIKYYNTRPIEDKLREESEMRFKRMEWATKKHALALVEIADLKSENERLKENVAMLSMGAGE